MKLDAARLCLDCDEIHEEQICPACSSEAFAFVTRWVKTSGEHRVERRAAPVVQPATTVHPARTPEQIEAYRQLIEGKPEKGPGRGLVTKGVFGIAAVSLLGWAWRSRTRAEGPGSDSERSDQGQDRPAHEPSASLGDAERNAAGPGRRVTPEVTPMRQLALLFAVLLALPSAAAADPLAHTYSIVARDPKTGELGVAVQSHWFSVGSIVTWAEAGVGAIATQSFVDPGYGQRGLELLRHGVSAPDALAQLVAADAQQDVRQVAIIDAQGRVAAHTGKKAIAAAGHHVGTQYSAQANLMANAKVWPAMSAAYEKATGDLADRLLAALDAGQAVGGDIRGRQSAAILIVKPKSTGKPWAGADRIFDLRVDDHAEPLDGAAPADPPAARLHPRQPRRRAHERAEGERGARGVRRCRDHRSGDRRTPLLARRHACLDWPRGGSEAHLPGGVRKGAGVGRPGSQTSRSGAVAG